MGAWGWNPWDNDGSGDMFDDVEQAAWNATRSLLMHGFSDARLSTDDKWERVGVVARTVIGTGSFGLREEDARRCVDWLNDALDDAAWVAGWKEPHRLMQAARFWRDTFLLIHYQRVRDREERPLSGILGVKHAKKKGKKARPVAKKAAKKT